MIHRHRYRSPPIEEAVCEFRFQPSDEWNLTIPGKLQTTIGGDYTGKPQEQRVFDVALPSQLEHPPGLRLGEGLAKIHLVTDDGKRKVGVGKDVLSIHMLRPYQRSTDAASSGWEEFLARIETALSAYWKVVCPRGILRLGIRYINKIVVSLSHNTVRIEEYLRCAPPDVEGLPERISHYLSRAEYMYDDGVKLILSHGTVSAQTGHVGFLLDIDIISEAAIPIDRKTALQTARVLRTREREAFEMLITDKARDLFDAS